MDNKPPWQLLGEEFVRQYYQVFDTNREQLAALYAVRVWYFAVGIFFYRVTTNTIYTISGCCCCCCASLRSCEHPVATQ